MIIVLEQWNLFIELEFNKLSIQISLHWVRIMVNLMTFRTPDYISFLTAVFVVEHAGYVFLLIGVKILKMLLL